MKNIAAGCALVTFGLPIAAILGLAVVDPGLLEELFWYTLYGLGGLAGLAFLVTVAWVHHRHERRERTYIDGALPMMRRRRHIWRSDIPRPFAIISFLVGEEFYLDPNRMISPAFSFDVFGRLNQLEPAGGWAAQHHYNLAVERSNAVRAIAQGDESRNNLFGRFSQPSAIPNRVLTPRPEPPQLPMDDEPPIIVEPPLTPSAALERSNDGVAYIGQAKDGACQLAKWDANSASTLGIFGANGTGKTSSVATMATLAMVRWGWKLWILDGKDAGDWDEFGNVATVEPVGQHNIENVMEGVWNEYQRREAVMSEYRARRYRDLPADVQAEFPQWGMVFEEFGATRLQLHPRTRTYLDERTSILCQKARYTGWHGVFIDQRPDNYPNTIKGNLKAIVCFQLLMSQGNAVGAYHADKLPPRGEFLMDGQRYSAFHAEPLARPALAQMAVRNRRSQPFVDAKATYTYESPSPEAKGTKGGGDKGDQTLGGIYERTGNWDEVAKVFFTDDATRTQADLRRLMVLFAGDGRSTSAFTGEAHRLYHLYNPNGQNYKG